MLYIQHIPNLVEVTTVCGRNYKNIKYTIQHANVARMRAIAVSLWIFINLVFVGMCGYIYLLWSQYWQYVERQQEHMSELMNTARTSGGGSSQIFYYNHDSFPSTEGPDVIAVAYRNKISALPKHHSYDKSGNKSSVGCKYVMQGMWI